jgi:hypothetical protein
MLSRWMLDALVETSLAQAAGASRRRRGSRAR